MLQLVEQPVRGRVDDDGKFYPSVSAVLDVLCPMDGAWMDDEARETGLELHAAMATAIRVGLLEADVDPRLVRLWAWFQAHEFTYGRIEETLVSRYGYSGTPDYVGRTLDNHEVIVDWKFAESVPVRYQVQLEAYRHLNVLDSKATMLIVQIPKHGELKVHRVKPNTRHWSAFLAALNILNWRLS